MQAYCTGRGYGNSCQFASELLDERCSARKPATSLDKRGIRSGTKPARLQRTLYKTVAARTMNAKTLMIKPAFQSRMLNTVGPSVISPCTTSFRKDAKHPKKESSLKGQRKGLRADLLSDPSTGTECMIKCSPKRLILCVLTEQIKALRADDPEFGQLSWQPLAYNLTPLSGNLSAEACSCRPLSSLTHHASCLVN